MTRQQPATARAVIEEATSRGAHDDCIDKFLFTLEENGMCIEAAAPQPAEAVALLRRIANEGWERTSNPGDDAAVLALMADEAVAALANQPAAETAGLDVLRTELADMESVGWPATSHEYRSGIRYALDRLARLARSDKERQP